MFLLAAAIRSSCRSIGYYNMSEIEVRVWTVVEACTKLSQATTAISGRG